MRNDGSPADGQSRRMPMGISDGPEIATGFVGKDAVVTDTVMAVTANPLASRAALRDPRRGRVPRSMPRSRRRWS